MENIHNYCQSNRINCVPTPILQTISYRNPNSAYQNRTHCNSSGNILFSSNSALNTINRQLSNIQVNTQQILSIQKKSERQTPLITTTNDEIETVQNQKEWTDLKRSRFCFSYLGEPNTNNNTINTDLIDENNSLKENVKFLLNKIKKMQKAAGSISFCYTNNESMSLGNNPNNISTINSQNNKYIEQINLLKNENSKYEGIINDLKMKMEILQMENLKLKNNFENTVKISQYNNFIGNKNKIFDTEKTDENILGINSPKNIELNNKITESQSNSVLLTNIIPTNESNETTVNDINSIYGYGYGGYGQIVTSSSNTPKKFGLTRIQKNINSLNRTASSINQVNNSNNILLSNNLSNESFSSLHFNQRVKNQNKVNNSETNKFFNKPPQHNITSSIKNKFLNCQNESAKVSNDKPKNLTYHKKYPSNSSYFKSFSQCDIINNNNNGIN